LLTRVSSLAALPSSRTLPSSTTPPPRGALASTTTPSLPSSATTPSKAMSAVTHNYGKDIATDFPVGFKLISGPSEFDSGRIIQEKFVFALVDYFNQTIVSNFNSVL